MWFMCVVYERGRMYLGGRIVICTLHTFAHTQRQTDTCSAVKHGNYYLKNGKSGLSFRETDHLKMDVDVKGRFIPSFPHIFRTFEAGMAYQANSRVRLERKNKSQKLVDNKWLSWELPFQRHFSLNGATPSLPVIANETRFDKTFFNRIARCKGLRNKGLLINKGISPFYLPSLKI